MKNEDVLRPYVNERLKIGYRLFEVALRPQLKLIYYPSCALDISPSAAFPLSRVIYVDIEEDSVKILQDCGYKAYCADATKFYPGGEVDLLILLNPAGTRSFPAQYVRLGGFVICNDYHHTATEMKDHSHFELIGIVKITGNEEDYYFDPEHPEDYWKTVESDEEFQRVSPHIFEEAKKVVWQKLRVKTDILRRYLNILDKAEKRSGMRGFDRHGEWLGFSPPRKKGNQDDLFVFRRAWIKQ